MMGIRVRYGAGRVESDSSQSTSMEGKLYGTNPGSVTAAVVTVTVTVRRLQTLLGHTKHIENETEKETEKETERGSAVSLRSRECGSILFYWKRVTHHRGYLCEGGEGSSDLVRNQVIVALLLIL
jgi:hypothetical protein